MNMIIKHIKTFFSRPFFSDKRTLLAVWVLIGILSWAFKFTRQHNNFEIFRGVYWHTVQGTSLYEAYPKEYFDVNHYGPFFSLVIAPFAIMPDWLGMLFWCVSLSLVLFVAVSRSNMKHNEKIFLFWFCAHSLSTALFMQQFNVAIAAIIIGAFYMIENKRDFWAAFLIMLGTFVKLYGIVGLAFFFFSKQKGKFLLSLLFWAVIMFVAPMLISSPAYILGQYQEWFTNLIEKNGENIGSIAQNISALGLVRRISGNNTYSDLWLILPSLLLFALPYLRINQYKYLGFRLSLLASVLLFVVLFSTGSESSSYIIALCGVSFWWCSAPSKRGKWGVALLVFVFMISGFGSSDLYPPCIKRGLIQQYALKALPCLIVWLRLCYEMMVYDYKESPALSPQQHIPDDVLSH